LTPPSEPRDPDAPTLGPWPINDAPFWRHDGKRFVMIWWWLAAMMIIMMGASQNPPAWVGRAFALAAVFVIVIPGGVWLLVWGWAQRARDAAKRERLEALARKIVLAVSLLVFVLIHGMLAVALAVGGWNAPRLPLAALLGVVVAMALFLGIAGTWVWLQWSNRFEIGPDWLVPTSYGKVRHKKRSVSFSEIREAVLFVAEPKASVTGPPRFFWRFETNALGGCEVDGDVLEEAKITPEERARILARVTEINAMRGGKTEPSVDQIEEEMAAAGAAAPPSQGK
jgi:hypothetical protein